MCHKQVEHVAVQIVIIKLCNGQYFNRKKNLSTILIDVIHKLLMLPTPPPPSPPLPPTVTTYAFDFSYALHDRMCIPIVQCTIFSFYAAKKMRNNRKFTTFFRTVFSLVQKLHINIQMSFFHVTSSLFFTQCRH